MKDITEISKYKTVRNVKHDKYFRTAKKEKYDNETEGALNIENVILRSCDIRITVASCMAI
mgnify:CR=1 FL=1